MGVVPRKGLRIESTGRVWESFYFHFVGVPTSDIERILVFLLL